MTLSSSEFSYADCIYGNSTYKEGAVAGNYVCINSEWIEIKKEGSEVTDKLKAEPEES